jgi:tryptophan synthase alpha chain
MNLLREKLVTMQKRGKKALVPFVMAGDPDPQTTEALLEALVMGGADIIELGVPFSDPLADGPVLQAAASRSLQAGTTPRACLELAARFREKHTLPLVLLIYYNLIFRCGLERFCREAAAAGISGLVVPDLPHEEAADLNLAARQAGLININLIAPTTSEERLEKICRAAEGFIYAVTVTGTTGEHRSLDAKLPELINRVRGYTNVPVLLGFGVSSPAQAAAAAALADGIIVGSALAQRLSGADSTREKCRIATEFMQDLRAAIRGGAACDC